MKHFCIWLLAGLVLVSAGAPATDLSKPKPVSLYGANYVDLREWAVQKGFALTIERQENLARMTNRWANVAFYIDSRRATINGINVWLSHAIAASRGSVFVGERDILGVINPILFPVKAPPGEKIRRIAIGAGHGGKDPGNQDGAHKEKDYTLLLAKELEAVLESAGFSVVQVRGTDKFVDLEGHSEFANKKKADLFIALHYNTSPPDSTGVSPQGIETYCLTPAGETPTNGRDVPSHPSPGNFFDRRNVLFAYHMQKALVSDLDLVDRGVRRAGFMVLRGVKMPGVLIEGGFMTNPEEARRIYDAKYRREMAQAIADGVLAYKRLVER